MVNSEDLFSLIHSMTKSEKGYFSKFQLRYGEKDDKYSDAIFTALEKSQAWDKKKFQKKYHTKVWYKNFSINKKKLFDSILRSLHEYYSGNSIEAQLNQTAHHIEILYQKGLHSQCLKLVQSAIKKATAYQKYSLMLHFMNQEQLIVVALGDLDELSKLLQTKSDLLPKINRSINILENIKLIEGKIFLLSKTVGFPRNDEEKNKYEKLIKDDLLIYENQCDDFWSKFHYLNIFNFYHEILNDFDSLYVVRKQIIEHCETAKHLVVDNPVRYLIALNNLLNIQDELKKQDELEVTLQKIRSIKSTSLDIQIRVFTYSNIIELTQNVISGDFDKNISMVPHLEEKLKHYGNHLHKEFKLAFQFHILYSYFGVGNFSKALRYVNQVFYDKTHESRRELTVMLKLINLIIHFELDNQDHLASAIRNFYRDLSKNNRLFKFENTMLAFLRESFRFNTKKEIRAGMEKLLQQITVLDQEPFEQQIISFFDIKAWLNSKIKGISFAQAVQENN